MKFSQKKLAFFKNELFLSRPVWFVFSKKRKKYFIPMKNTTCEVHFYFMPLNFAGILEYFNITHQGSYSTKFFTLSVSKGLLNYGFCKKSLWNETLTSWTLLAHFFFRSAQIQCWSGKKVSQKCSTGQSFIFSKWVFTTSIF